MTQRIKALAIVVLGLICAACEEISAMDWRFYTRSEFGSYQYDAENARHLSDDLVRVCEKLVLNDRGAANLIQELGREYVNVKEICTLREIDCTGKRSRILGLIYVSETGEVIKKECYEPVEWDSIIAGSVDDVLYQVVCE